MRVLYLAGLGRNGSTIVSNVLGTVPGLFPVGEVRSIWSHGFINRARCGCNEPIPECDVWSEIAAKHLGGLSEHAARRNADLHRSLVRLRYTRALTDGQAPGGRATDLEEYATVLSQLYQGIHEVTGCDVIVDSSKSPPYAAILARIPGIEVRVIHQVRDSRASAFSWTRQRAHTDLEGRMMPVYPPWKTALLWNQWNAASEELRQLPYLRVRYEDFVADPRREVRAMLDFAGIEAAGAAWTGDRAVAITSHHMVHGNPSRGKTGSIELRADTEWKTAFPPVASALVTAMTLKGLRRYGYPFRG